MAVEVTKYVKICSGVNFIDHECSPNFPADKAYITEYNNNVKYVAEDGATVYVQEI